MKRKKFLWIKKDDAFASMMDNHEVVGTITGCNWHECEFIEGEWVRVSIDWDESGERNTTIGEE